MKDLLKNTSKESIVKAMNAYVKYIKTKNSKQSKK
jgi:hypothetical protein